MPLSIEDIKTLVDMLGSAGAKAGIEYSHTSLAELRAMVLVRGVKIQPKAKRSDIAEQLVMLADERLDKTLDEMLEMSTEQLLDYFEKIRPGRTELLGVLEKLDFHPGSEAQKSLYKYAARQISETGMFQRVARPKLS